ncbi:MAG: biopolymer transporter ExbD [Gemmatimonadetes bacterium]|nr:biopolymer transporter ExbD [Gemmatimonadota bacterium]
MAVLGNKKSKISDEIPSSSMADIAFLLLIFFLVTTTFPKDKGLQLVLPQQGETQEVSLKNVLHIIVQPGGQVVIKRGESQQEQNVRADALKSIWRQDVEANPNLIASVNTHPDAPYRMMIDVLDALQAAGADRISLNLLEE